MEYFIISVPTRGSQEENFFNRVTFLCPKWKFSSWFPFWCKIMQFGASSLYDTPLILRFPRRWDNKKKTKYKLISILAPLPVKREKSHASERSSNKTVLMILKSSFSTCHTTFNQTKYLTSLPAKSLHSFSRFSLRPPPISGIKSRAKFAWNYIFHPLSFCGIYIMLAFGTEHDCSICSPSQPIWSSNKNHKPPSN